MKSELKFTGERLIPKLNQNTAFYYEHLNRYLFANQLSTNKTVLDCACGTGYGSYIMSKFGKAKHVIGIDISPESVKYAQNNYQTKNVIFQKDNILSLSTIKNNSIDLITCFETIEHIKKPDLALKQFDRILKSNGILVISTPNKDNYLENNKFHLHELNLSQFTKYLHKYFKNVLFLNQKFSFSQEIYPKNTTTKILFNHQDIIFSDSKSYGQKTTETKPEYFIALCSNTKLPKIYRQQFSVDSIDSLDMKHGIIPLENKIFRLERELSKISNELSIIRKSKFYRFWPIYCKVKNIFIK